MYMSNPTQTSIQENRPLTASRIAVCTQVFLNCLLTTLKMLTQCQGKNFEIGFRNSRVFQTHCGCGDL